MKIIDKTKPTVAFYEVKQGDVFAYGEYLYMKTEVEYVDGDWEICDRTINAIYLSNGSFAYFEDDQRVTLVDAQLVLGGN